jgi:hypothetical protein
MPDMTHNTHEHNLISEKLIELYMERFVNRSDIWGKQWVRWNRTRWGYSYQKPEMDTKGGRYPYQPVTPQLVQRHFAGNVTCAWSSLDETLCSKWLCFDSDIDDGALERLESFLKSYGWRVIREGRREGRDGHAWLLFDKPVPANQLIILGDTMMTLAGVKLTSKENPKGIERFPKTATGYSQVRGPLGVNLKPDASGARGWFDGVEHNLRSQLEWLAGQPLNRAEDAIREAEKHRAQAKPMAVKRRIASKRINGKSGGFQILDHVVARQVGREQVAQCPLCAQEGHDQHQDNLKIKTDGTTFCCVYGGPDQVHKVGAIISALIWR